MLNRITVGARAVGRKFRSQRMAYQILPILAVLSAVALLPAICLGQVVSSSLVGTLVDPVDAAIPNMEITLANPATGATLKTESNAAGLFRFPNLLPGTFTLTVRVTGFKAYTQRDIVVASSETRDLGHVQLQLGNVTEEVSVTAEATPLQTASSEKSSLVTGTQLSAIALKGRDFFGLVDLLPGVVDTRNRDNTSNASTMSGMYINGLNNNTINYTIDGVTANDTGSNSDIHYNGNMDSIAEVRVLTSNYQAEYGRKAGATISVITKGGGRDFHGTAYWSHRHEEFNANNFFNNSSGLRITPYRFNIAGYNLAGPVLLPGHWNKSKDKLFFFFGQEYTRQRINLNPVTQYRMMPTALERTGDFSHSLDASGKLIPVIDPTTRVAFPGNVVPQNQINPVGQAVLNFLPLPNYSDPNPSLVNQRNYMASGSAQFPRRNTTIRIDANPTSRFHIYWRFIQEPEQQDNAWGQWFTGSNYLLQYSRLWRPGEGNAVNATYTITPTLVNEFTFGKSYSHVYYNVLNPSALTRDKMGNIPQWFTGANGVTIPETSRAGDPPGWLADNLIPDIQFGSTPVNSPTIGLSNTPYENWNEIYSVQDNITKVAGNHNLKAGIYVEHTGKFATNQSGTSDLFRGVFNFGANSTNPYDSNNGFSNALLGNFYSYTESNDRTAGHFWFWNIESFVQDNWRATRRLTIDIGARIAYLTAVNDTNHSLAYFDSTGYSRAGAPRMYAPALSNGTRVGMDPGTGATVPAALIGFFVPGTGNPANGMKVAGVDGNPTGMSTYKTPSISPRFGFAWDAQGNGKTAVRGGWGMFTDRPNSNETAEALQGNPPVTYSPTLYYGNLATFTGAAGYLAPSNITYMYGNYHVPVSMNYSLGIQQSLGFSTVVDASYVGNQVRHLWWYRPLNNIPAFAHFNTGNFDPTNGKPLPDNFLRPYTGWGSLSLLEFNNNSNYNAAQVSVRHQFSKHMMFAGSYTYSKDLGYQTNISSYFNPRFWNYGLLSFDRTNVLTINYVYELPALSGKLGAKWLHAVTDDWRVSGVTTFSSGAVYTPSLSTTYTSDISGSSEAARIQVVGDPYLPKSQRTFSKNFNTAAFALPAVGTFGNAGIGVLRGPGTNNFDLTIGKKIPVGLGERRMLDFRAEAYNAFNHTQFTGIDSGARFDQSGNQTNLNFGAYNSARAGRVLAFTLRFAF
jgi:hypothetical protein